MKPAYLKNLFQIGSLVVATALLWAGPNTAAGAIRLTITESGGPSTVYFTNGNTLTTGSVSTANFTLQVEVANTNFAGQSDPVGGNLSQSILSTSTTGSAGQTLYVQADVVNAVGSIAPTGTFNETGNAAVTSDTLALFTQPAGPQVWGTASITGTSLPPGVEGTATTYVNGVSIYTGVQAPPTGTEYQGQVNTPGNVYTLAQLLTVSSVPNGSNGFSVTGQSNVHLGPTNGDLPSVPEPATLAMWSLFSGLGLVAAYRRKRQAS